MAQATTQQSPATTPTGTAGSLTFQTTMTMTVTDLAAKKFQEFLGDRPLGEVLVRISVQAGGCSGASYGMEFAETAEPGESTLLTNGVKILVHPDHAPLLNGLVIDFADELMGGGFKIANPNAKSGCGCGKSFSA